jgi:hypothetical protein
MNQGRLTLGAAVGILVLCGLLAGCEGLNLNSSTSKPATAASAPATPIPEPVSLMLPKEIRIHPFTGTRTFDDAGGIKGIDVRIEAVDAYGDATKAFGDFRFELYTFKENSPDPKKQRIALWEVPLMDPKTNLTHWDNITRTYEFKLQWDQAIPVGQKFVLVAVYSSPYTQREFAERTFVSGQ